MLIVDDRGERPLLTIVTPCCGARLWAHLHPTICPTCGAPVTMEPNRERELGHLKHTATRYWS